MSENLVESETSDLIVVDPINVSSRFTVGALFGKATGWLALAFLAEFGVAWKLLFPGFLAGSPWLTHGRLDTAADVMFWYGFLIQALIGTSLWINARIGKVDLQLPFLVGIGLTFWNLGVIAAVVGILAGGSTGIPGLEMPGYASFVLLISYLLMAIPVLATFHRRGEKAVYVSQCFILASVVWFAWIFSAALYFISAGEGSTNGLTNAGIGLWYQHNLKWVVGAGSGFAILSYLTPKILQTSLNSRSVAFFGLWTLILTGSWGGASMGSPFPAWYSSIGVIADVWILAPVGALVWMVAATGAGSKQEFKTETTLRWIALAVCSLALVGIAGFLSSLKVVETLTGLTFAEYAGESLFEKGFLVTTFIGAIGFILAQLSGSQLPSICCRVGRDHRLFLAGLVMTVVGFLGAGLLQGLVLSIGKAPFSTAVQYARPLLFVATFGMGLVVLHAVSFALRVGRIAMTLTWGSCCKIGDETVISDRGNVTS